MPERCFLTNPESFRDVSRGNPRPHSLKGDDLVKARLTPETWRLEIVSDGSTDLEKPRKLDDNTALDFQTIEALGKKHGVRFLKAMQCLNIAQPLGQGLWEGVPLREVLKLAGKVKNIRRVYWHGFHNNDPKQIFQSSLGYNQVMETPPWDLCPFVAYRLNGQPISLVRGGPVRMVIPWAHGFKSIKWLHRITLTNDSKANDTYAEQNNDPDSYLKTAAYLDDGPQTFKAGEGDRDSRHGDGRLVGIEGRGILDSARHRHTRQTRRRRPGLAEGEVGAGRHRTAADGLGRPAAGGRDAEGRLGLRRHGQTEGLADALQRRAVERDSEGTGGGSLRIPCTHHRPERVCPAGAAAVSEIGA